MKLRELTDLLENIAPPEYALESDRERIGLLIECCEEVNKVAVSLDATDTVLNTAAREGADLLITHHSLFFEPLRRIPRRLADTLRIALDNNLSLYVMHTNYDAAPGGVNDVLAELLKLEGVRAHGLPRTGDINPQSLEEFSRFVGTTLNTHVQWMGDNRTVEHVMVLGGSGFHSEYIDLAVEEGVDVLVSGELRHSAIRQADTAEIALIDATHHATENPAMKRLASQLPIETIFIEDRPLIRVTLLQ